MKRNYVSPEVFVHGSVLHLTAASLDSDRQDRIFDASGNQTGSESGSLDQCFFEPGSPDCIINEP